jgi:hypothetical protein
MRAPTKTISSAGHDALDAFVAFTSRGDFEQALKLPNKAADCGDAQGYYVLGFIFVQR